MGGSKETTTQKIPSWAENAFKDQMQRANLIASQGYVPYQGADVAAFTPQQTNAMQSAANWSAAFGGPGAQAIDVQASLPQAQRFNDGTVGYSSYPGYVEQLAAFKAAYPGQAKLIESMAVNPVTGAQPLANKIQDMKSTSKKDKNANEYDSWWKNWEKTIGVA